MTAYVKSLEDISIDKRSAVTLGKFDGLHRGHQKLVRDVISHDPALASVIVSFEMSGPHLMTGSQQLRFLDGRADVLIHCPFTDRIRCMSPDEFVKNILVDRLHAAYVCVGEDFRFGYKAMGDVHVLKRLGEACDFRVRIMEKERMGQDVISSSLIKDCMMNGLMEKAQDLLGYTFSLNGPVVRGRQIGRTIGFPTMNIAVDPDRFLPARGVYVCFVCIGGRRMKAVANIGTNPTVTDEGRITVEAYAFDFAGDVYGQEAELYFLHYIRPEYKLSGVDELREIIASDKAYAVRWFKEHKEARWLPPERALDTKSAVSETEHKL